MKLIPVFIVILLSLQNLVFAKQEKPKWQKFKVEKMLSNERLLISDGRIINIWGIKAPLNNTKNRCFARKSFSKLKKTIEGENIRIWETKHQSRSSIQPKHIKFAKGQYLTEFILKNGLGKFQNPQIEEKFVSKYEKAEKMAKNDFLGVWSCSKPIVSKNKIPHYFRKKYHQYLDNISVGRVKKVYSGTEFKLENNVKVKMIGLQSPSPDESRKGLACFGRASKEYLTSIILDKTVHLHRDRTQFSDNNKLLRYVFLSPQKNQPSVFVNKEMIKNGFAKSHWSGKNDRYEDEFESLQKEVYQAPCGAWKKCIQEIIADIQKTEPKKELVFDQSCPIKGNISGSKKNPVKKYHTPASRWYKNLKYETCFETEDEAEFAGFLKVK